MRILIVSPVFLLPMNTGTKVRISNLMHQWQNQGHEVGLICFADQNETTRASELTNLRDLRLIHVNGKNSWRCRLKRLLDVLPLIVQGVPKREAFTKHYKIIQAVEELSPQYDLIFIEFYFMAFNVTTKLLDKYKNKFALVEHDISFIPLQRTASVAKGFSWFKSWLHYIGGKKAEYAQIRRFSNIVTMSEHDAAILRGINTHAQIIVAPNGVDCTTYTLQKNTLELPDPAHFIFLGGMEHYPNLDAMRWFIPHVWPLIQKQIPQAQFTVIGAIGKASIDDLQLPGVRFAGFVEELHPWFAQTSALVCPFRIGGGTRLKILEALASGTPIVSTTIGAEGIPMINETHFLLAETPEDFAKAACRLSLDKNLAAALAKNGRTLVEEHFNWPVIAENLIKSLAPQVHHIYHDTV